MSAHPPCEDGWYTASASNVRMMKTSDGMPFVQVRCELVFNDGEKRKRGVSILWRGSLTRGATVRTYDALCAMGSRMSNQTGVCIEASLRNLDLVGSQLFRVQVRSLPCDDAEAYGKWRTFIVDVKPMESMESPLPPSIEEAQS